MHNDTNLIQQNIPVDEITETVNKIIMNWNYAGKQQLNYICIDILVFKFIFISQRISFGTDE